MERKIYLMTKIITRINHYFLADEGEYIPASDLAIFYGVMLGFPVYTLLILLIA